MRETPPGRAGDRWMSWWYWQREWGKGMRQKRRDVFRELLVYQAILAKAWGVQRVSREAWDWSREKTYVSRGLYLISLGFRKIQLALVCVCVLRGAGGRGGDVT